MIKMINLQIYIYSYIYLFYNVLYIFRPLVKNEPNLAIQHFFFPFCFTYLFKGCSKKAAFAIPGHY